jgi:uncharacterized protein (DUF433 family)/predicted nuclease of predicted toxin-antitoxin system
MRDQREDELVMKITLDPGIYGGKPLIQGRRLAVEHIMGMLSAGSDVETLLEGYPWLQKEDVLACFAYSRRTLGGEHQEELPPEEGVRLYLDTCVWGAAKDELRAAGYDVVWGGDRGSDPSDAELLATARKERRVIVTLDPEFGERARLERTPTRGVLRLVNVPAERQGRVCLKVLEKYGQTLAEGAMLTTNGHRLKAKHARPYEPDNGTQDLF